MEGNQRSLGFTSANPTPAADADDRSVEQELMVRAVRCTLQESMLSVSLLRFKPLTVTNLRKSIGASIISTCL